MPDLLIELRSEEIPARMQRKAAGDLKKLLTDALVEAGLTYEGAREYWTPRRLTLDIRGLTAHSADLREEKKGPSTTAPQQAIDGFLRGAGLASIDQAETRTDPKKGDFYVAIITKPGRSAEEIVADVMPGIIRNFPWPKSMRSGTASAKPGALRWVRPLQSIVCMWGTEHDETTVIPFEVDGIVASNITYGHRFHAPGAITVRRFSDYVSSLEKAKVVLDAERRKEIILSDAKNIAFASGLDLVEDEALLEEVSGLVEYPHVLMGTFEEDYLKIPAEIIRLTIKTNQKCFVTRKQGTDELSNRFILISNIEAKDDGKEIVHGNGKVVRARLSDAAHFYKRDQADMPDLHELAASAAKFGLDLKKPLDQRMAKLDHLNVTFHAKLGTQGERVTRIRALAAELAKVTGADPIKVDRAAVLAKADLRTEAVGEFPELQGLMGRRYALLQGEDASVAAAIEEHWKPNGPSDRVPTDAVSVTIALADKLDTLVGFWAIDEKPTGSKDPYALRRAALGVISVILENKLDLDVNWFAYRHANSFANCDPVMVASDLSTFFGERLKVQLKETGIRPDIVDAVLNMGTQREVPMPGMEATKRILSITRRAEALAKFIDTEDGKNLLAGTKRATQLLAAEEKKGTRIADRIDLQLLTLPAEKSLHAAIVNASQDAASAVAREDFGAAMEALSRLRGPVDTFFNDVLVNDENADIRANRLALLSAIRAATATVADFSKISG
ncbi:glycine--tRNA ligase subunit beta [Rhizobium sp. LjRoot254]|uniref:glycine--tRNA ligase subunit beta n=1 Tax=Rhizobium sp. LjRoot254 TaxID=3342297 RepID=UPI003ECD5085